MGESGGRQAGSCLYVHAEVSEAHASMYVWKLHLRLSWCGLVWYGLNRIVYWIALWVAFWVLLGLLVLVRAKHDRLSGA